MNKVKVMVGSPQKDMNQIYRSGYSCLDDAIVVDTGSKVVGFYPATEVERARKNSICDSVFDMSDMISELSRNKEYLPNKAGVLAKYLLENNIKKIEVSGEFPVFVADYLRYFDITINVSLDTLYPAREVKTAREISYIKECSDVNVRAMDMVHTMLAESSVNASGELLYKGAVLTSEFIQSELFCFFLKNHLASDSVIVAVGDQGVDPHEPGYGAIKVGQSVVVDIYPYDRGTHYYSDMTRTFCKHKASDELQALYNTVKDAQEHALSQVKAGVNARELHTWIQNYFLSKGYKTGVIDGTLQGFFHGTGHGVGLDCHEVPYISRNGKQLKSGQFVTVEPGLYYLGVGGVRIEDLVLVEESGCQIMTPYKKELIVE